jgi:iron-sulfur cluster assembly accessory protein
MNTKDINIKFTQNAIDQIQLIQDNDYTVEGLYFRLKIDGKGCGGFDYAMGFTDKNQDDLTINIPHATRELIYIVDPFTAHYCKNGVVDFIQDFEKDTEGFYFENDNEKKYRGKFFKNEAMLPSK